MRRPGVRERSMAHWGQLRRLGERKWVVGRVGRAERDSMGRNARCSMHLNQSKYILKNKK